MLEKRTIGKFYYAVKSWKQSFAYFLEKFNSHHRLENFGMVHDISVISRAASQSLHSFPPALSRFSFPYIIVVYNVFRINLGVVKYDDHVAILVVVA